MLKNLFKIIVLIFMVIGIILGISITVKKEMPKKVEKEKEENVLSKIQTKTAEVTKFYTYGRAFNLSGKINNIEKDNFEGAKLVITKKKKKENIYTLNYNFEENTLYFSSDIEMNSGIILDNLDNTDYYILLRLQLNNSANPRYYTFSNISEYENIEYYTMTSENKNKKVLINFEETELNNQKYSLLKITLEDSELPDNIYDIVIDAGHGGTDTGEKLGEYTEANITLEYAKMLKQNLEEKGFKVKLTRDDTNTGYYTDTNMYDEDGRITESCESKAKLMISFHVNNGADGLKGFEIYSPPNSNLDFANEMANKIKEYSNITYSNNNSFKKSDGVYVWNFTNSVIDQFKQTAERKGYEPYPITTNTPYLYTIREVGGIATGAYVDGRNTSYSKNQYYNSNQGIECYQIELGYIKNDLNIIVNEKENYIRGISEAIENNF